MQIGTLAQSRAANNISCITVTGTTLKPITELKSHGVILDSRLTFTDHMSAISKVRNYHLLTLRHIRHLLTQDAVKTLACSIMGARLGYCSTLVRSANVDGGEASMVAEFDGSSGYAAT